MTTRLLTVIRHAKSSWSDPNLPDKIRPLNCRGKRDLPLIGQALHSLGIAPELVLCSTSRRTLETLDALKPFLGVTDTQVRLQEQLYEASAAEILTEIAERPDDLTHLLIIAHNPGLTELINQISDSSIANLPTLGVAQLRFEASHWQQITESSPTLQLLLTPKALLLNQNATKEDAED